MPPKFTEAFSNAIRTLSENIKKFDQEIVRSGNDRILMQKKSNATRLSQKGYRWIQNSIQMKRFLWLRLQGSGSCGLFSEIDLFSIMQHALFFFELWMWREVVDIDNFVWYGGTFACPNYI